MTLLLFYLFLALGVSFFCSIAEAVLLSVRPVYVVALRKKGTTGAKELAELRENLDRPLAAILSLNTIAHTVGAAGVGAQATFIFGNEYLGIISAVLTLLILVFSEIIPKTVGALYWRSLAPVMGILIMWLTTLLLPFVWFSDKLTRLLSPSGAGLHTFSRDEMQAMAQLGEEEGILEQKEVKIVHNLMRLHKLSVRDIMTPRVVMFSLPADLTVRQYFEDHAHEPFSRIPIFSDDRDRIKGYVLKHDLIIAQAKDEFDRTLSEFRRDFYVLPDKISASEAFDRLTRQRSHLCLLVDEYGTTKGLVSLEDIVETLIGMEILDEQDTVENLQMLARQRWRERMETLGIDPDSLEDVKR